MIRAELPVETFAENVQEEEGIDEAPEGERANPAATLIKCQAADEPPDTDSAEAETKPMRPDSARYAPQSAPIGPVNAPGGTIACPECGMENVAAGGRRFCGDCGTSLWEKCPRCGEDVPVDERFCGQCGANLSESVQTQMRSIELGLAKALRLEMNHQFSEAIAVLSPIVKIQNSRLTTHVERAEQRLRHVRREQGRWERIADEAYEKAQEAVSSHNFRDAIRLLEEIPPAVRSTPMQSLLLDAQAREKEIETLDAELRRLLAEKRTAEIAPLIERLLRLQPSHALAAKVGVRMRDQLVAAVEKKTAARCFDEAQDLLRRIPSPASTAETEALALDVAELSALCWHANHSQYVDESLKEVLTRLLQRLPNDEAIKKLAVEYRKRRQALDSVERTGPLPWASAVKSPWGCPVEWLFDGKNIETNEIPAATRRSHPGEFAVAFGLALQGIDKGPVKIDFSGTDSGVMGRVAKLMREKRYGSAWGIDIGDHSLKVVKLQTLHGGRRVQAAVCEAIPHRKLLSQASNYGEARDLAEESLNRFRELHSLKRERLCLSLPGRLTICRTIRLPAMPEKKIDDAFQFEARHVLPSDLSDYRWHRYDPNAGEQTADRPSDHLLLAVSRRHIGYAEEMFERLKIQPDILQCEYLALHNYLGFELGTEAQNGGGRPNAAVLLDMGACGTNLVVHSPRCLWAKYLGVGGHTFSRALVREFRLTLEQAEQWKRNPSGVEHWSRWEAALGAVFETFSREFNAALGAFSRDHPGEKIDRILIVGGGMQTHGLMRYLRTGR